MSEELKLLPCPFCGGTPHASEGLNDYEFMTTCWDCDFDGPTRTSRADAIKAWNTRPNTPTDKDLEDAFYGGVKAGTFFTNNVYRRPMSRVINFPLFEIYLKEKKGVG